MPQTRSKPISWWKSWIKRTSALKVKPPRSYLVRLATNIWNERLTPMGRFVAMGAVGSLIAGSFPEQTEGSYLFSFFISFIGIAFIISLLRSPKIKVERMLPVRCAVGAPIPMLMVMKNTGTSEQNDIGAYEYRLPEGLVIHEPPQFVESIPPQGDYTLHYTLECRKRGSYALTGPSIISAFPFGLSQSKLFWAQPHHLLVHPRFTRLHQMTVPVGARYQPNGMALTSRIGESMEFIGTREYQTGDRMRDIHPRSWARVGFPIVRQYQEEYLTRVAMMIDTYVPPLGNKQTFEGGLSLGAAVADYLARQEFVVDTFCAGPDLHRFQSGRSLAYLDNILDVLSCIDSSPIDPIEDIAESMSDELARTSTVIMIFITWNKAREAFVDKIRASGAEVRPLLVVQDKNHKFDKDAAAAGVQRINVSDIENGVMAAVNERFQTFSAAIIVIISAVAIGVSANTFGVPAFIVVVMALHLVWGLTIPTKPYTVISFLMAVPFAIWFSYYPNSISGYGGYNHLTRLLPILGFYILLLDCQQILCFRHGGRLDLALGTAIFAFTLAGAGAPKSNPLLLPLSCVLIGVVMWELRRNLWLKTTLGHSSGRRFPLSQVVSISAVLMVTIGLQLLLVEKLPDLGNELIRRVTNGSPGGGMTSANFTRNSTVKMTSVSETWDKGQDDDIALKCWSKTAPHYLRGQVYSLYDQNGWHAIENSHDDAHDDSRTMIPTGSHHGRNVFQMTPHTSDKVAGTIYPEREFAGTFFMPIGTHQIACFEERVAFSNAAFTAWPLDNPASSRGGYEYYESVDHMGDPGPNDKLVPSALRKDLNIIGIEVYGAAMNDDEKVRRLIEFFAENFKYKLGTTFDKKRDPNIQFLTDIRAGHCEYFASAGALLLRSAGIPARYVTGFRCDESGLTGNLWISRRRDAHAWIEAYLPNRGWITVETTPATAMPTPIEQSFHRSVVEWVKSIVNSIAQFLIYGGLTAILGTIWDFLVEMLIEIPKAAYLGLIALGLILWFRRQIREFFGDRTEGKTVSKRARELQKVLAQTERTLRRHKVVRPLHMTVADFITLVHTRAIPEPVKARCLAALEEYNNERFIFQERPEPPTPEHNPARTEALQVVNQVVER